MTEEGKIDFNFDEMPDVDLEKLGSSMSKFKPTKVEASSPKEEEMPSYRAGDAILPEPKPIEEEEMPSYRAGDAILPKPGPIKEDEMPTHLIDESAEEEEEMPPRPVFEEETKVEKSDPKSEETLVELGSKIDEIMNEDSELRSVFDTMSDEEKEKIVKRLEAISKEYDELVDKVTKEISKMEIEGKDVSSMNQDDIVKELRHLDGVNTELRRIYSETSNPEVETAIEEALNKLNNRYNVLVAAYNSKNEKTM